MKGNRGKEREREGSVGMIDEQFLKDNLNLDY